MRRALLAALFVASSLGIIAIPAGADSSNSSGVVLSFDFSDNSAPAAMSNNNANFNIITDVLPEHSGGVVRMVAIAPDNSGNSNLVCPFQPVQQNQVECTFQFTTNGVWSIKSQWAPDKLTDISSVSITNLRVTN